jgi:hypothetical protein
MEVNNLQQNKSQLTPGSMIMNSANNKNYGVVVNNVRDKIIVFRLENDTYPVFSELKNNPYIRKSGTINEYKNEILKQALLKYISNTNLTENEKKLLNDLTEFAFPLGVPQYRPDIELPERDQENLNLGSHLVVGKKMYLNTPLDSPYRFLNNSTVDIIDLKDNGIWVVKPNSNGENSNYFLFYKNKEIPNFAGISRAVPLGEKTNYLDKYVENYKQRNNDNHLPTTMIHNGEKVKVLPDSKKVIFPIKYQNLTFEPRHCKFLSDTSEIKGEHEFNKVTNLTLDGEYKFTDLQKTEKIGPLGAGLIIGGGGSSREMLENFSKLASEKDEIEHYYSSIGSDSGVDDPDVRNENNDENDDIEDEIEELDLNEAIYSSNKTTESSDQIITDEIESDLESIDDIDESDYNFIDEDDIEEKGVFQKIRRVEVAEVDKIYKDSIQKGDLFKYKIEKVPRLRRNDINILDKISKEINIISILKHKVTNKDNTVRFQPENFNGLIEKYLSKDFSNQLLIPIVINKKNIYIGKDGKVSESDYDQNSTNVITNYYSRIKEINNIIEKPSVNYDNLQSKLNEFMNPTEVNNSTVGLMFKFGENMSDDNIHKLNQDTLTIRYCNNNYNCQSFQLISNDFDCQVNLGPIGRYIGIDKDEKIIYDEEEEDELIEEDNKHSNIDYTLGKFKIIYSGDTVNVLGFMRPPLKYFTSKDDDEMMNLAQLYKDMEEENKSVKLINLEDLDEEDYSEDDGFNILKYPDHFVCIMMNNNLDIDEDTFKDDLYKIIPNVEKVLDLYKKSIVSIDDAYHVLSKFDYEYSDLGIIERKQLFSLLEEKNYRLENKIKVLDDKFKRKQRKEEEEELKKQDGDEEIKTDCSIIDDELMEELLKYYYETYINLKTQFDSDKSRLNWFNNRIDNGNFMINTMILNYYLKCEMENPIEDLTMKLGMLKEEFERVNMQKLKEDPVIANKKKMKNQK